MSIRDTRREAAIERMADHVLREGLAGATLRPMAAAAGTSDRMLLYYFADKDEVLAETLTRIAHRLTAMLDAAMPPGTRLPYYDLLVTLWAATGTDMLRPYMSIWIELAGAAARGMQPHAAIAHAIMSGFAAWAADHLDAPEAGRDAQAALLIGTLDGLLLLAAAGRRDLAELALTARPPETGTPQR
ncbi:TetR/AcrR family transcriptional regulator [Bradyrhizobium sp.]|uniref:TetR/AcrR family transcriptional regulator n=1 Tax=Bradyrhizobium sp. TaxID=376 RepID=UPI0025B93833|nr:TetR/AcrR family transcriptional regulator [Bradyrhizobium sp.]